MNKFAIYIPLAWIFTSSAAVHAVPVNHAASSPLRMESHASEAQNSDAWQALSGQSLRDAAAAWSSRAGYELVWDADYDFPIRANVRLKGDFVHVLTNLFNAYASADRPLTVDIYKEQKLVYVKARGE